MTVAPTGIFSTVTGVPSAGISTETLASSPLSSFQVAVTRKDASTGKASASMPLSCFSTVNWPVFGSGCFSTVKVCALSSGSVCSATLVAPSYRYSNITSSWPAYCLTWSPVISKVTVVVPSALFGVNSPVAVIPVGSPAGTVRISPLSSYLTPGVRPLYSTVFTTVPPVKGRTLVSDPFTCTVVPIDGSGPSSLV